MKDQLSLLTDEDALISEVLVAPTKPFSKNYEKKSVSMVDDQKQVSGITLKH